MSYRVTFRIAGTRRLEKIDVDTEADAKALVDEVFLNGLSFTSKLGQYKAWPPGSIQEASVDLIGAKE